MNTTASTDMLQQALAYLEQELPIFPVCSPGSAGRCLEGHPKPHGADDVGKNPLVRWGSTGVVRPPGTVGWSDAEVMAYAKQNGLSPYSTQGWGRQAGGAQYVAAHRPSVPSTSKQTATQARAELPRLTVQLDQLQAAGDHMIENGDATFYRRDVSATPEPLPWDNGVQTNATAGAQAGPTLDGATGTNARVAPADAGSSSTSAQAAAGARAVPGQAKPAASAVGPLARSTVRSRSRHGQPCRAARG